MPCSASRVSPCGHPVAELGDRRARARSIFTRTPRGPSSTRRLRVEVLDGGLGRAVDGVVGERPGGRRPSRRARGRRARPSAAAASRSSMKARPVASRPPTFMSSIWRHSSVSASSNGAAEHHAGVGDDQVDRAERRVDAVARGRRRVPVGDAIATARCAELGGEGVAGGPRGGRRARRTRRPRARARAVAVPMPAGGAGDDGGCEVAVMIHAAQLATALRAGLTRRSRDPGSGRARLSLAGWPSVSGMEQRPLGQLHPRAARAGRPGRRRAARGHAPPHARACAARSWRCWPGSASTTYVRLEQGRDQHPSAQVLGGARARAAARRRGARAPARAGRRPSRPAPAAPPPRARAPVAGAARRGHDRPSRRSSLGRYLDVLAANALAVRAQPRVRARAATWCGRRSWRRRRAAPTRTARRVRADTAAALRASVGTDLDDPRLTELVGELSLKSPEFRRLWARQDVRNKTTGRKRYHNPLVGELDARLRHARDQRRRTGSCSSSTAPSPAAATSRRCGCSRSWCRRRGLCSARTADLDTQSLQD